MTKEEWIAACLADAPPLSPSQLAVLRPLAQQMARHMKTNAAPAMATEAAHARPPATQSPGGINAKR